MGILISLQCINGTSSSIVVVVVVVAVVYAVP